jgi:hypothetical protein
VAVAAVEHPPAIRDRHCGREDDYGALDPPRAPGALSGAAGQSACATDSGVAREPDQQHRPCWGFGDCSKTLDRKLVGSRLSQ